MLASFEQPNLMFAGRANPFKSQGVEIMGTDTDDLLLIYC